VVQRAVWHAGECRDRSVQILTELCCTATLMECWSGRSNPGFVHSTRTMAEPPDGNTQVPSGSPDDEAASKCPAAYLKFIDNTRKAVAIAMAVCRAGFAYCVNRDDYLIGTLREEPGIWPSWWVFGAGGLALVFTHIFRRRNANFQRKDTLC
jgi:hypothetical protein